VQIATRQAGKAIVVDVIGDIDLYNSPEVRKTLLDALRNQRAPVVLINLTKVKYIDSSGVASLVEGLKISRELQSRFILFGLSPAAREVLELSRLIKVFEVYANEEEALKAVA
jgi:anti-sigma B factor antagonist